MKSFDGFRSVEKVKYAVRTISIDELENEVKKKWLTQGVVAARPYRANDEKAPSIVASDWWIDARTRGGRETARPRQAGGRALPTATLQSLQCNTF